MQKYSKSPTDDAFVQDPYGFYDQTRIDNRQLFFWKEYDMPCSVSFAANWAILRDRRFGREVPKDLEQTKPEHQAGFWAVEDHSLLELEPPRHTRLRSLILRAFTSRRIASLEPEIAALCAELLDDLKGGEFDLLPTYAQRIPVIVIARLLGIPDSHADDLLGWSHAIVGMYQAGRTHKMEVAAADAASEFAAFMRNHVDYRRTRPADDLITHLIAAEEEGEKLTTDELISTCILLLNAGHEATVHSIGNGVSAMLRTGMDLDWLTPTNIDNTVEEIIRFDAPVQMFQRWAYDKIDVGTHQFQPGDQVACILAGANRDPKRWENPNQFDPTRPIQTNVAFGAGVHFCIGAPLARLEMRTALPILFDRMPNLSLIQEPRYTSTYHFHGLEALLLHA